MTESIYVRGEGGSVFKMDLPLPEPIAERLTKGLLRRVNADGSPHTEPSPDVPGAPAEEPAKSATKAEWIGWAVANGADLEEVEAMTKADLIEKYGGSDAADQ